MPHFHILTQNCSRRKKMIPHFHITFAIAEAEALTMTNDKWQM